LQPFKVIDEEEEAYQLRKEAGLVRTGRLFGGSGNKKFILATFHDFIFCLNISGLIDDVKRKAPFYLSDFTDGFSMQCVSTYFFIYFACLTPIVTFGGTGPLC
jgi:sodium bicarbonate transporter 10